MNENLRMKQPGHPYRRTKGALILVLACGVLSTGWLLSGCGQSDTDTTVAPDEHADEKPGLLTLNPAAEQTMGLQTEVVARRTVSQTLRATGSVGPNDTRVAHLRPLARGRIERVFVRLGDRVRTGQPLVAYDNIELGERIGEFVQAFATATVAQRSLERARQLVGIGAISQAEFDRRSAEYANTLAGMGNVEEKLHRFGVTEAEVDSLRLGAQSPVHRDASHSVVRAPFNGLVVASDVSEGETVDADRELLTITDLSTVWVQADVYEKDIASVREGQTATVRVEAYPDRVFTGRITYVSDVLDAQTRAAKVRCEVPNPDGLLKLEMFATIQIPTSLDRSVLMAPASAVQQIKETPTIFVQVGKGQFQSRSVTLGTRSEGWIEVIEGLREGETVVTQGSFVLKSLTLEEELEGGHDH